MDNSTETFQIFTEININGHNYIPHFLVIKRENELLKEIIELRKKNILLSGALDLDKLKQNPKTKRQKKKWIRKDSLETT